MTVRVRGIYSTAVTSIFDDIVQASPTIEQRFDEEFSMAPADVLIETTEDRQGIGVVGTPTSSDDDDGDDRTSIETVISRLQSVGLDTFTWRAALPQGAVFAGTVVDTLGSGALVECGNVGAAHDNGLAVVAGDETGFLPYSKTNRRVEEGDTVRVQVAEPRPPWDDGRPVLDTTIRVQAALADIVRGGTSDASTPELADIVPADPPAEWAMDWAPSSDDADLDDLGAVIDALGGRAEAVDEAVESGGDPSEVPGELYYPGSETYWLWFGRESRFALDEIRRDAKTTMNGHHRIKAGTNSASAAVDFVEALCDGIDESEFPFGVVTRQFGPAVGDQVSIGHGKPDGRLIDLGPGDVTERSPDGKLTVRREMSGHGTYDALGTERKPGDEATTKFKEGRWWYPTVYRSEAGEKRGTYVNICTPVELFPETVRYVDLHVDVIKQPDGTVSRVDEDELTAAVEAGTISEEVAKKARTVASAVENAL